MTFSATRVWTRQPHALNRRIAHVAVMFMFTGRSRSLCGRQWPISAAGDGVEVDDVLDTTAHQLVWEPRKAPRTSPAQAYGP